MATVLSLPNAALPAPPSPAERVAAERTIPLSQICWRLGDTRRSAAWRVEHVRQLIRSEGFPHPFPRLATRAGPLLTGIDAVHPAARWDLRAVDAWFDGLLPPGARAALVSAAEADAADELDARADALDDLLAARGAA